MEKLNHYFIHYFITDKLKQQKMLLPKITDSQVDMLGEIIYNLIHVLTHTKPDQKFIARRLNVLKKISD